MKTKYWILYFLILYIGASNLNAHNSYIAHGEDIMAVFGFVKNGKNDSQYLKLFYRGDRQSWVKFISSDMIDNNEFHLKLEAKLSSSYPGFNISRPNKHRLLFHWAYEAEPWSDKLEEYVKEYCSSRDINPETLIRILKQELRSEQARRNREIIKETKEAFGFMDADGNFWGSYKIYTHFFASMAYNIHLLGDYMTDNTELDGLHDFNKLVGAIVVELRNLDYNNSTSIVKGITRINHSSKGVQEKADELMLYLKNSVPKFIQTARNGNLRNILEGNGFYFAT